jgi:phage terminase large subunit-like protein
MEMLILWPDVGLMTLEEDVFADLSEGKDPALFPKANPNLDQRKYIYSRSEVAVLSSHCV